MFLPTQSPKQIVLPQESSCICEEKNDYLSLGIFFNPKTPFSRYDDHDMIIITRGSKSSPRQVPRPLILSLLLYEPACYKQIIKPSCTFVLVNVIIVIIHLLYLRQSTALA